MLLWSPAHFAVDDAVLREVLHEFPGDAGEPLFRLHHGDREVEGLEVLDERAGVALRREPLPESARVGLGNVDADGIGELDDRRRAQRTVEMVVQRHLRQGAQRRSLDGDVAVRVDRHVFPLGRGSVSSG